MQLTETGYVPTGEVEPIWEAKDVSAFAGLLKLGDYKHVEGLSAAPQELRDDLANKRAKREQRRKEAADRSAIPKIHIEI